MPDLNSDDGLVIVAPTAFELSAVRTGLNRLTSGKKYRLMLCGVGEKRSRAFCSKLDQVFVSRLVLVGWGGGLSPDLKPGTALCANAALYAGLPPVSCDSPNVGGLRIGSILTSPKALLTPAEKQTAAQTGALAVEMEAYPLAAWAKQRGIPFRHGRVILDAWDETLPELGLGASGELRPLELLKRLILRPALFAELARLRLRVQMLDPLLAKLALDLIVD